MRHSRILLGCVLLVGCSREAPVKAIRTVDTPHGRYDWKETTHPAGTKIADVVRDLTDAERAKLRLDANAATAFIRKYAPDAKPDDDLPFTLDVAFAAWMKSEDPQKEASERVIRIVGASFGFYCIDKLGVHWAIIQDEQGVDTALVRADPETRSFPFSSIRYRVEDRKTDFIYGLYVSLDHIIKEASHQKPNQSSEPTAMLVTPRAEPRVAPSTAVAHL